MAFDWKTMDRSKLVILLFTSGFIVYFWQLFLTVGLVIIAFLCGVSVRLHRNIETESLESKKSRKVIVVWSVKEKCPLPSAQMSDEQEAMPEFRQKLDLRVSGSALIDETIQEMTDYIVRDYVHTWYDSLTDDDEFIHELRATVQVALVTLSSRVKEVDWIPYLTTVLVDDSASHLRLFRQSQVKLRENCNTDLVNAFFDLESNMERILCRDMVSLDDSHFNGKQKGVLHYHYIQGFSEAVLYFVFPQNVCPTVAFLAQDLLVTHVITPVIKMISDPDFMNQLIIWMCQFYNVVSPDVFMALLRSADNMDEICTVTDFFEKERSLIEKLLNQVSSTEDDKQIFKQQLRCLNYVKKSVEEQFSRLKEGNSKSWIMDDDSEEWQHYTLPAGVKVLTLEEVLKNSVSLSYFLDYMNTVGGNYHLLLYLNADAWRVSGEVQLLEIEASSRISQSQVLEKSNQAMLDCMREAALNIYDQFLSDKSPKIHIPETVIKRLYVQLKTEKISSTLFDDVQAALIDTMLSTEKFFPGFTHSKLYIKSLMELDLLKIDTASAHSISSGSDEDDEVEIPPGLDDVKSTTSATSEQDLPDFQMCYECLRMRKQAEAAAPEDVLSLEKELWSRKYKLKAEVIESALTVQKGKTVGIYVVLVTKADLDSDGTLKERTWHIYRRYSDFYDFHLWIKSKWMKLSKIEFPGKQTFGKTDRAFLEKRMAALNKYMSCLLAMTSEQCFGASLQDSIMHFLEPGSYSFRRRLFSEKIDNIVHPLKQTVKNVTDVVRTMPDSLLSTMDGLSRMFYTKSITSDFTEGIKVGAAIDNEVDDNIPLRIILLLMDEVFDLKSRNQWLRRRLVVMIRQIIKTMMGDNLNKRIIDNVAFLTSPVQVAWYMHNLETTLWPGGEAIHFPSHRDQVVKDRTRIATKMALLSVVSEELKHLIGSDTTRRGLRTIFELCQNPILNRRLLIVLLEGIVKTLYQDKPFHDVIQRLHFRSNRVSKYRPFLIPSNFASQLASSPRVARKRAS